MANIPDGFGTGAAKASDFVSQPKFDKINIDWRGLFEALAGALAYTLFAGPIAILGNLGDAIDRLLGGPRTFATELITKVLGFPISVLDGLWAGVGIDDKGILAFALALVVVAVTATILAWGVDRWLR